MPKGRPHQPDICTTCRPTWAHPSSPRRVPRACSHLAVVAARRASLEVLLRTLAGAQELGSAASPQNRRWLCCCRGSVFWTRRSERRPRTPPSAACRPRRESPGPIVYPHTPTSRPARNRTLTDVPRLPQIRGNAGRLLAGWDQSRTRRGEMPPQTLTLSLHLRGEINRVALLPAPLPTPALRDSGARAGCCLTHRWCRKATRSRTHR
jgi:hypothetical protein